MADDVKPRITNEEIAAGIRNMRQIAEAHANWFWSRYLCDAANVLEAAVFPDGLPPGPQDAPTAPRAAPPPPRAARRPRPRGRA